MASSRFDMNKFVKDYERAFDSKDFGTVLAYYEADVEFTGPDGKPQRGIDAFEKLLMGWAEGFSAPTIRVKQGVQNGKDVAILQTYKARNTGEFEMAPGERMPPTNKTVEFEIAEFIQLNDQGKIVRDVGIMDFANVMKQLGVMPGPQQDAASRRTVQR